MEGQKEKYSIDRLIQFMFSHWGKENVRSGDREIINLRHIGMDICYHLWYLNKVLYKEGPSAIGRKFGGYTHCTVWYAHKKICGYYQFNKHFKNIIDEIESAINDNFEIEKLKRL